MISKQRWARAAGFLVTAVALAAAPYALAAESIRPDDTARLLAGLQPSAGSPAQQWAREPSWQHHARWLDQSWQELERRQLSKIRAWSEANLTARRPLMWYMFSGPDFLYADAFFPHASTYILSGLEPTGPMPQLTEAVRRSLPQTLGGLRASLDSVLSYSFFITKKMRSSLNTGPLSGTLPVLYVFLARAGKTIQEVNLVELRNNGEVVLRSQDGSRASAPGVEIIFQNSEGELQALYYFQTDISDRGLASSGLLEFLGQHGRLDSLIKSASYLMHSDSFSKIRQMLLDRSETIVQDDSGIPVQFFDRQEWQLSPFGRYLGPIDQFPGKYQGRLAELFRKSPPSLDFGIGYRWRRNESNLLLARRKDPRSS